MIRPTFNIPLILLLSAIVAWGQEPPDVEEPENLGSEDIQIIAPGAQTPVTPPPPAPSSPTMDFADPTFGGDVDYSAPTEEVRAAEMTLEEETISVDFPDEEVRVIISNVVDLYDLNVVIPDTLVGSTTLKIRNVSWKQVFEVVLEPLGFSFVKDRNIIKIRSNLDLEQEKPDTRVFIVNFANASEIQGSIAPLIGEGGRVQVDARSNAFVITERPTRMNNIQEIIERLDRPTAQVMIETKFIEVTNRDAVNLGVNWSSLNSYQLSAGPFQRDYNRDISQTAIGNNDNTSINTTDNISENSTDFTSNIPVPGLPNSSTNITNNSSNTVNANNILTQAASVLNSASQGRIDTAVFSAPAFNVVLSALESLSDSKLISNPTVVTLNNTPATINIGEEFPIPD